MTNIKINKLNHVEKNLNPFFLKATNGIKVKATCCDGNIPQRELVELIIVSHILTKKLE